jgi:acyl carrier protein
MTVTFDRLEPIFKTAFDKSDLVITDQSTKNDIEEWDSLNHLNLVVEIEDAFQIKFSVDEIEEMNSVEKILSILNKKSIL